MIKVVLCKRQAGSSAFTWLKASQQKPRAVAVVIHGLNLKPEKMDALGDFLRENNVEVLRVSLAGHRDSQKLQKISRKEWLAEVGNAYQIATEHSQNLRVPLYFIGYSLGAVLGLDFISNLKSAPHFEKMIFIAPPLSIRLPFKVLLWLSKLFGSRVRIPSLNSREYRVNSFTSLGAYLALGESIESLNLDTLKSLPALFIFNLRDELVNVKRALFKLKAAELPLTKIWFTTIHNGERRRKNRYHLMIDLKSMGCSNWTELKKCILDHLFD